jgi:Ca2+-binding EF-hand superfamily protein
MAARQQGGSGALCPDVAKIRDGKARLARVRDQKGPGRPRMQELKMTGPKMTAVAVLLLGAVFASGAMAEMGPGGGQGEGRGAMLLEMFDGLDTDADGKLSPAELAAHREAMFTAADANTDGLLDQEEIAAHQTAMLAERMGQRVGRMLERRDVNGDGSLSLEEMGKGPAETGFARMDADGDGLISKEELQQAGQRFGEMRRKHKHGTMGGWFN